MKNNCKRGISSLSRTKGSAVFIICPTFQEHLQLTIFMNKVLIQRSLGAGRKYILDSIVWQVAQFRGIASKILINVQRFSEDAAHFLERVTHFLETVALFLGNKNCDSAHRKSSTFFRNSSTFSRNSSTFTRTSSSFYNNCSALYMDCTTFLAICSTYTRNNTGFIMKLEVDPVAKTWIFTLTFAKLIVET